MSQGNDDSPEERRWRRDEDYELLRTLAADVHELTRIVTTLQTKVDTLLSNPAVNYLHSNSEDFLRNAKLLDQAVEHLSVIRSLIVFLVGAVLTVGALVAAFEALPFIGN